MSFAELPPSTQWAALKYRGEKYAEVWFKPEGEPFGLTFRIPQKTFQTPDVGQRLTMESLLKSVGVAPEEVESWRYGEFSHSGTDGADPELRTTLPAPSPDVPHLEIHVRMKRPPEVVAAQESGEPEEPPPTDWDHLVARWSAIMGLEGAIETLRLRLESLRVEMETAWKQPLTTEEKVHALNADVSQWNKAKSRVHYALPKIREFTHRAMWVMGTAERKELEKIFESEVQPELAPLLENRVPDHLENLLKERQVLSSEGESVYQECRGILSELQGALRRLQMNAASNLRRKRDQSKAGGKFFKDVRRWSMGGG